MKMSKLTTAILAGSLLMAGAASAEEAKGPVTVTGSVAFTTDYLFRGISQSSNNAAVQGSMTFAHDSGLYFTAWGSSIASGAGGLELDTLLGYAGKAGDVGYDVGVMRYNYPGLNDNTLGVTDAAGNPVDADYNEVYASVSFSGAKLGVNYSPDYFAESDAFLYVYGSYATEVAGVGLAASVGLNSFDDTAAMAQALGYTGSDDSYIDYKLAVSKSLAGVALELAYMGSDIDDTDLANGIGEGRAVLTASKAF
jgi:uncharacterized protein (TIGR02001 family)